MARLATGPPLDGLSAPSTLPLFDPSVCIYLCDYLINIFCLSNPMLL